MSTQSAPDPIAQGRTRAAAHRLSRVGRFGLVALALILLGCLGALPWALGTTPDDGMPRYAHQDRSSIRTPPAWVALPGADVGTTPPAQRALSRPLLGTDALGRDLLARCVVGGAISLGIALAAAGISVLLGTLYGSVAGFVGGRVDDLMMRAVDVLYGLPYVLMVVLLAVAVDGAVDRIEAARGAELLPGAGTAINIGTLVVAIGGVSWLTMARVVRGQVLSLRAQPFMEAARAIGASPARQFTRHLLPNLVGPIVVYATLTVPQAILQESFLSFLGIGIRPPTPSWGNLAAEGLEAINPWEPARGAWWTLLAPCVLLGLTLLALNFVGEALRESMDPKSRVGR